jgi:hypothetical protein
MGVPCDTSLIPKHLLETQIETLYHHVPKEECHFLPTKRRVPNSQQFVCMTSSLLSGYFAICQHLLTIMCRYQTIWSMCQTKAAIFLPTKEGPSTMCETECLFTLTRDAFVICQHPFVICVHIKHSLQQNMVFPSAIGLGSWQVRDKLCDFIHFNVKRYYGCMLTMVSSLLNFKHIWYVS